MTEVIANSPLLLLPEYSSTSVCWRLRAGTGTTVWVWDGCKYSAHLVNVA